MAPLSLQSNLKTGNLNWKWGQPKQKAFDKIKEILSNHAILAYSNFAQTSDLYIDAGGLQLGATLVQDDKPIGFYTGKLNSSQMNYTVGKKELLGIVQRFKAFEGILRGAEVIVHTDHLNLLYQKSPTQKIV